MYEVIGGDSIDKSTGFIKNAEVFKIILDAEALPATVKFGAIVECDVQLSKFFNTNTKQQEYSVRYVGIALYSHKE